MRPDSNDVPRGPRWLWVAMPWGLYTTCAVCGQVRYCHGKTREHMLCLECFADDERAAKLRRGGMSGKRTGYTYKVRRAKAEMVTLVAADRAAGKVVGLIAEQRGLSEKTVRNYLARARRAEK